MVKATAMQVYSALVSGGLPVVSCDAITDTCYFSTSVTSSAVHAIVDPLEWTGVTIEVVVTDTDPYSQYLNTTRHDLLIRHEIGTVVPHDTSKIDGPASSTDNAIVRFDLATGKVAQNSLVTIDDSGSVNIPSGQSYKINGTALAASDVGAVPTTRTVNTKALSSDISLTASDVGAATTSTKLDDFATPDDNTDLNANTTNHGLLLKATAPASGILNVVGIANGETVYSNKALFDDTNPVMDGTAAPGTSLLSARRDHVHPTDTSRAASVHNHDTVYSRFRGVSSTTPSDPIAGDIWIDTTSGSVPKIYDGSSWISLT